MKKKNFPVFVGQTHIGQVYSLIWSHKIGKCAVYDPNKQKKIISDKSLQEEPKLKKYSRKKITYYKKLEQITNHDTIFITIDTPINSIGKPDYTIIEKVIKKIFVLKFKKKLINIFLTSQVYPGFTDKIKKNCKNKNIRFIYMVDTLKMGDAISRFLHPKQIIFGCEKSDIDNIKKLFNLFKAKKYFLTAKEAELIKLSINIYLFFSISFANIIDEISKDNNIKYPNIIKNLRNESRIGKFAYILPSLGLAGGHLERDLYYLKKINKNRKIKLILNHLNEFNYNRRKILEKNINKKDKILIVGSSYKKESFSFVNSFFREIIKKKYNLEFYDSLFNLKSLKNRKTFNFLEALKKTNVVIYNYANIKDFKLLKKYFKKNKSKKLINISYQKLGNPKQDNIKNIF